MTQFHVVPPLSTPSVLHSRFTSIPQMLSHWRAKSADGSSWCTRVVLNHLDHPSRCAGMFKQAGGVNQKYKAKYRSLSFNLKDPTNPDLRRKVRFCYCRRTCRAVAHASNRRWAFQASTGRADQPCAHLLESLLPLGVSCCACFFILAWAVSVDACFTVDRCSSLQKGLSKGRSWIRTRD